MVSYLKNELFCGTMCILHNFVMITFIHNFGLAEVLFNASYGFCRTNRKCIIPFCIYHRPYGTPFLTKYLLTLVVAMFTYNTKHTVPY